MSERDKSSICPGLRGVKLWRLRVGEFAHKHSILSPDPETERAIAALKDILSNHGLLVLDAHKRRPDIFASSMALIGELNPDYFIAPVAGYIYHSPWYRPLFREIKKVGGVDTYGVYRAEERNMTRRRFTDRSGLSEAEKDSANRRYLRQVMKVKDRPRAIATVAPYASRKTYGEKIRDGVILLLRSGIHVVCTASVPYPGSFLDYQVRVSDSILKFSKQDEPEYIQQIVFREFERLYGNVNVE